MPTPTKQTHPHTQEPIQTPRHQKQATPVTRDMQKKIGTSRNITGIAQLSTNSAIATSVSHTRTTTDNYQHSPIASEPDRSPAKDIPKPNHMQEHPHDTNNTRSIIHQLHGNQPKPSLYNTPKLTPVHSTQAELTTAAPRQLPCTLANSSSLNQTQQCIQNSPNCLPEPPKRSPTPTVTSDEPYPSFLEPYRANNTDCLDQILNKLQDLSNTFQNLSTALSMQISQIPPPENMAGLQPQVSRSPRVDKPTPDKPHPILLFDLTPIQGHLPTAVAHWFNSFHWPYIDLPTFLQQPTTDSTSTDAALHGSRHHSFSHRRRSTFRSSSRHQYWYYLPEYEPLLHSPYSFTALLRFPTTPSMPNFCTNLKRTYTETTDTGTNHPKGNSLYDDRPLSCRSLSDLCTAPRAQYVPLMAYTTTNNAPTLCTLA